MNTAQGAGPVVGWGNLAGNPPPPSVDGTTGTASAIAAGMAHSCALQAGTGAAVCWGGGNGWQAVPDSANGTLGVATAIAAGGFFAYGGFGDHYVMNTCAIQAGTAAVICWGGSAPPSSVDGTAGGAMAVSVGLFHSCAIQRNTGAVVCWSNGSDGLGNSGNSNGQAMPPPSVDGTAGTASAISAGGFHSCAIQTGTSAVICWGSNVDQGGFNIGQATPPSSVNGISGTASAIATGSYHSCAIQVGTGAVVCWGDNWTSQATPPDAVNGTNGTAAAIAAYGVHSCAIQAGSGAVVCWGYNYSGEGTPPDAVNGTAGIASAIALGSDFTLAVRGPCRTGVTDPACQMVDIDDDGAVDGADNCPFYPTPNRTDDDGDGRGDACECTDQNGDGRNTVADIVAINAAIFNPSLATPLCDGNNDDLCNVSDIIAANVELFSPTNTSTCARQPVPGP